MAGSSVGDVITQATSRYKFAEIAQKDIMDALGQFKDLRPGQERFYFNDGRRMKLLNLSGTIPVEYKGNVYNIPVTVWLLDTHPYNPPMVYVNPTSDMCLKANNLMDSNGKLDLPYLRDWRYPQSDLLGLIQIMVNEFSKKPPVYSNCASSQQRRQTQLEQGELLVYLSSTPSQQRPQVQRVHSHPPACTESNEKRILCFVKLTRLSRDALQIFFDDVFPGHELQTMLTDKKHLIKNGGIRIHKDQIPVLYPDKGEPADSCEFGISTMYTLLRNYAENVEPPSNGWGNEPNIGQKRHGDDVERVRIHRNYINEMIEFEHEMDDFNLKLEDLKQVVQMYEFTIKNVITSSRYNMEANGNQNRFAASIRLSKGTLRREIEALST